MAEVVLHGGAIALVDDEDLQSIAQYKWYLSSHGYAVRTIHVSGNKKEGVVQRGEAMHRVVMKAVVYKKKHLGWFYTEAEATVHLNKVKHESQSCSQD